MCICINCRHISKCTVYSFIQKQHNNFFRNNNKMSFNPPNTIIHISINKNQKEILLDWDLKECVSFAEEPGNWLRRDK
uniref:Ycf34 n=1 Tax=Vertebrata isogona TaxID=2006944 RepID=A0A1Z1MF78_9FLOR|nr:hypothetical protein [Vertebrata isogona]ARW64626.1 hypothetical protein [Vertebrata isogona]